MRIYTFKSETSEGLRAFAADEDGSKLPHQFAPWLPDGVIETSERPPHNLSRIRIEGAIRLTGFQLWRIKQPAHGEDA
jgi:hypothetical protein